MIDLFLLFWSVMIFASIGWYGFLIFYVGYKGGREIRAMTREFKQRDEKETKPAGSRVRKRESRALESAPAQAGRFLQEAFPETDP